MFTNLRELIQSMPTEESCREYLVKQRWNDKPVCPYCGHSERVYKIENGKRYKCGNSECYKKFSCTVGTIFEASNVPLSKWFTALYLVSAHKKGISSYQVAKDIGVSQKTAWFMLHRLRELMRVKTPAKLNNVVEIDETWVGAKVKNMSKAKRAKLRTEGNGTIQNKTMVAGFLERGGELRLIALGKDNGADVLQPLIRNNVDSNATIITDGLSSYKGLANNFTSHEVVNHHNEEYVVQRTDAPMADERLRKLLLHTNSIEGAFGLFKRSIIGIYHYVSPQHLARYCDETAYRYNLRNMNDATRFDLALENTEGRLTYKDLINAKEVVSSVEIAPVPRTGFRRAVVQLKDGVVIGQYPSLSEAARTLNLKTSSIGRVLQGKKNTTGGFGWKYA